MARGRPVPVIEAALYHVDDVDVPRGYTACIMLHSLHHAHDMTQKQLFLGLPGLSH